MSLVGRTGGGPVHTVEIRVRYEETDQMGVVYYAKYLVWFEVARTELFRAIGLDYRQLEDREKIYLPVAEACCRYRAPIRYDDLVSVTATLSGMGNTRIEFDYEVKRDDVLMATGKTKHAFVDRSGSPIPVPERVRDIIDRKKV